jgi:hypothetical protein
MVLNIVVSTLVFSFAVILLLLVGTLILYIPIAISLRRRGGDWEGVDNEGRMWHSDAVLSVVAI